MDHNDVFRVRFDPITRHFCNREEEVEWWTVVVGPMESRHSPTEVAISIIRGSLRDIDDQVIRSMALVQELRHLKLHRVSDDNLTGEALRLRCYCDRLIRSLRRGKTWQ